MNVALFGVTDHRSLVIPSSIVLNINSQGAIYFQLQSCPNVSPDVGPSHHALNLKELFLDQDLQCRIVHFSSRPSSLIAIHALDV